MAPKTSLVALVSPDDYLFDDEPEEGVFEGDEGDEAGDDDTISLDDAVAELGELVENAVDFIESKMLPDWEKAERYFAGETDLEKVIGRSQATDTVVRDAIRNIKPNLMRIFTQADKILEYSTSHPALKALAVAQTNYNNRIFWTSDGYRTLLDCVHDALVKSTGIMKVAWRENYEPRFIQATKLTPERFELLQNSPHISILRQEATDLGDGTMVFDADAVYLEPNGKISVEYVLLSKFFIDESATSIKDARVVGQRDSITIGDCVAMGLDYDNWDEIDDEDAEAPAESEVRRGYSKDSNSGEYERDPSMRKVLITEVYARFDLEGIGIPQLYRFWLGGTKYVYLDHERVDEAPYHALLIDPVPGSFFGRSIFDILKESQDAQTSLLRALLDNAHFANNPRLAVHETMVNLADVISPKIGAPIRVRAPGMIAPITTQPSVGSTLPLLADLRKQAENKAGTTNAAMGLDPDALQSTTKDAVRNTIQLALGQVEMMARNVAETGLQSAFRALLVLSMRHLDTVQMAMVNGQEIPVSQADFLPHLAMQVKVGLGNASYETRLLATQEIVAHQVAVMEKLGVSNPITDLTMHFNALEARAKLLGIEDISQYFKRPDPQEVAAFQQQMEQKMAQQKPQQPDPSQAIIAAEQIKSQARQQETQVKLQADMQIKDREAKHRLVELLMKDDLSRDELAQRLQLEAAKINGELVDKAEVRRIQEENNQQGQGQ